MYLTAPDNPRSMNPEALSKLANKYCTDCTPVSEPTEACRMAINDIKQNGGTLVTCGSFYLAGEVRGYLWKIKIFNPPHFGRIFKRDGLLSLMIIVRPVFYFVQAVSDF